MKRLLVHVEGETEEQFVNVILAPHLAERGWASVSARLMGSPRLRSRRGGVRAWEGVRHEIERHLLGDREVVASMLVDFYAMPRNWPGRETVPEGTPVERAAHLAAALRASLDEEVRSRFVPCILMHEFEALLFSDCTNATVAWGKPDLAEPLQAIRAAFPSPEHINDSPQTAPSKRLLALMPGYEKPLYGALAVLGIGLGPIREECAAFEAWLGLLEHFGEPGVTTP